jgi:Protein of unknown function (DUF3108)
MNCLLILVLLFMADKAPVQADSAKPTPPAVPAAAKEKAPDPPKKEPEKSGEVLNYSVNWPTGLSLGEARLNTTRTGAGDAARIETDFHLDASVPGFPVLENHHSVADSQFCSVEFKKQYTHGKRKADETEKFNQADRTAERETKDGGGKSTLSIPACAKDALAYIGFVRRELGAGRLPPRQQVYYGAPYDVKVEFTGKQSIRVNDTPMDADRLAVSLKGPSADISFEVFFAKDQARTPVMVRVPLPLATFSLELVR